MKRFLIVFVVTVGLLPPAVAAEEMKLDKLMHTALQGVADTEVILSRVEMPPNATLPRHWHPGEEFAYVLSGSVTLWQQGEEDVVAREGEVVKIPLEKVHTAIAGTAGATVLVFRVHEQGKPERVLVK